MFPEKRELTLELLAKICGTQPGHAGRYYLGRVLYLCHLQVVEYLEREAYVAASNLAVAKKWKAEEGKPYLRTLSRIAIYRIARLPQPDPAGLELPEPGDPEHWHDQWDTRLAAITRHLSPWLRHLHEMLCNNAIAIGGILMRWHHPDGTQKSPGEIVGEVYSKFEPAPLWRFEQLTNRDQLKETEGYKQARLYCATCGAHNTLRKQASKEGKIEFLCRSCNATNPRPAMLRRKGNINGKQDVGGRDKDWWIVDGLEAGRVMSAVENLGPAGHAWALCVHTELRGGSKEPSQSYLMHRDLIILKALSAIDEAEGKRFCLEAKLVEKLARLHFECVRQQARNGNRTHTLQELADELRLPKSSFAATRKWGRIRTIIDRCYDQLDRKMDAAVIEAISPRRIEEMAEMGA